MAVNACACHCHEQDNLCEQCCDGRPAPMVWQPIETAPKDGREILLTDGAYKRTGYWARRTGAWSIDAAVSMAMPAHWISLPVLQPRKA